ncbi:MAG: hypothetical protein HFJ48_04975 [Clostridia bacterium]|nr:hypothetical protein [Clostridia bacterium]
MAIKEENEITVKIKCSINELCTILNKKEFNIVDKFTMNDIFMIPNTIKKEIHNLTSREILKKAVLIRNKDNQLKKQTDKKITFKKKEFDYNGDILSQQAINCDIVNIDEAIKLFEAIGYYKIMHITENDVVYGKDDFEIAIKDIQNGDNLIEIETVANNKKFNTIEKLKKQIIDLEIPIDTTNFFVKKAEVELNKLMNK